MSEKKIDEYSGRKITGHEWNGITELDTPIPKAVWFFLILAVLCAFIMWILLPSWPTGGTYTKGLLGVDEREVVKENLVNSAARKKPWEDKIETMQLARRERDEELDALVTRNGKRLFEDNCARCHGSDAKGRHGYPNLIDNQWLWGGNSEQIMETIRVGINTNHEDTRYSEMMAFGRDGVLGVKDRQSVIYYIQAFSNETIVKEVEKDLLELGATTYEENCAVCHGDNGKGIVELGAPNLSDEFWLYGSDYSSIASVLRDGRQGVMPSWGGRLSNTDIRMLTFYLLKLGETQ